MKKRLKVKEILPYLQGLDYVILEGFEYERTLPKIVAAKTVAETQSFMGDLVVAISGLIMESDEETKKVKRCWIMA